MVGAVPATAHRVVGRVAGDVTAEAAPLEHVAGLAEPGTDALVAQRVPSTPLQGVAGDVHVERHHRGALGRLVEHTVPDAPGAVVASDVEGHLRPRSVVLRLDVAADRGVRGDFLDRDRFLAIHHEADAEGSLFAHLRAHDDGHDAHPALRDVLVDDGLDLVLRERVVDQVDRVPRRHVYELAVGAVHPLRVGSVVVDDRASVEGLVLTVEVGQGERAVRVQLVRPEDALLVRHRAGDPGIAVEAAAHGLDHAIDLDLVGDRNSVVALLAVGVRAAHGEERGGDQGDQSVHCGASLVCSPDYTQQIVYKQRYTKAPYLTSFTHISSRDTLASPNQRYSTANSALHQYSTCIHPKTLLQ